jgi:hypothetical protein
MKDIWVKLAKFCLKQAGMSDFDMAILDKLL